MASKIPVLRMIVSFDPLDKEVRHALASWGETVNVQIKELSESTLFLLPVVRLLNVQGLVESFGEAHLIDPLPASPDQIASLCYTSVRFSLLYTWFLPDPLLLRELQTVLKVIHFTASRLSLSLMPQQGPFLPTQASQSQRTQTCMASHTLRIPAFYRTFR